MRGRLLAVALSMGLVLGVADSAHAIINYLDCIGTTVDYVDIAETNSPDIPLFGAPDCSGGDSIDFDPIGFFTEINPGFGFGNLDSQLNFSILAKGVNGIEKIMLDEAGDYDLLADTIESVVGLGGSTATVTLNVRLEVNATTAGPVPAGDIERVLNVPVSFQELNGPGDLTIGGTKPWTLNAMFDLVQILEVEEGFAAGTRATAVDIVLDNTLNVYAENGEIARIAKKDADALTVTVIPEPSTGLLLGFGLAGLAYVRRRRP